jgi:hypothetical protein
MPPQGLLTFPGLQQILSWSYTLSHGITPGVAQVEIAPQLGVPAEIGPMVITFDDVELVFPGCVLDSANIRRDGAGMVVSLAILDRRWTWRFGQISGRYNLRQKNGKLDPATEQAPQDLATLLLVEMGESEFDVSGLPNESRPEIDWDHAHPAQELARLAEQLGCRVVLDLDSRVSLAPAGFGADLPDTQTQRTVNFGIDPPTRPDSLLLVGAPTRFQSRFRLEAVGLEQTGEIEPIDNLSYKPAGGWQNEPWFGFPNVADADDRALARQTVYRWYRIKCTAPSTDAGDFEIAGYDGPVEDLWQLLPLERGLVETFTDVDSIERPRPPEIAGIYWDRSLDGKNIPERRRWPGRFSIDAGRGIVRFAEPVLQVSSDSGGGFIEAELYLTVAHGVKDVVTLQEVRETVERVLPGEPIGTGPKVLRRDDLGRTVVTKYDDNNNPTGTTDNADSFDAEAEETLDAAEAAFQTLETGQVEYAGVVPISPDGAIQQVEWRGGTAGCVTRASRNSEFSLVVPPWHERRAAERRRDETAPPAAVAALREIRNRRGAR